MKKKRILTVVFSLLLLIVFSASISAAACKASVTPPDASVTMTMATAMATASEESASDQMTMMYVPITELTATDLAVYDNFPPTLHIVGSSNDVKIILKNAPVSMMIALSPPAATVTAVNISEATRVQSFTWITSPASKSITTASVMINEPMMTSAAIATTDNRLIEVSLVMKTHFIGVVVGQQSLLNSIT